MNASVGDEPRGCLVRCRPCDKRYTYPEYVALPLDREESYGDERVHVRLCDDCGSELSCLVATVESVDGVPQPPDALYYANAMWADEPYVREQRERYEEYLRQKERVR